MGEWGLAKGRMQAILQQWQRWLALRLEPWASDSALPAPPLSPLQSVTRQTRMGTHAGNWVCSTQSCWAMCSWQPARSPTWGLSQRPTGVGRASGACTKWLWLWLRSARALLIRREGSLCDYAAKSNDRGIGPRRGRRPGWAQNLHHNLQPLSPLNPAAFRTLTRPPHLPLALLGLRCCSRGGRSARRCRSPAAKSSSWRRSWGMQSRCGAAGLEVDAMQGAGGAGGPSSRLALVLI